MRNLTQETLTQNKPTEKEHSIINNFVSPGERVRYSLDTKQL